MAKPDGRIALNVWRAAQFNPVYHHFIGALEKHLGANAADVMPSPFVTRSVAEMRSLLEQARFREVQVIIPVDTVRFPSIPEFVRQEIESMPVPDLQMELCERQEDLTREMCELLESYVDDWGLLCPVQDYVAVARR